MNFLSLPPATKGHFRSEPEMAARGRYCCTAIYFMISGETGLGVAYSLHQSICHSKCR